MSDWKPTRIRWVTRTLQSSTGAALVETDLGAAYVKLLGNPEGPHALFCELVGSRAAAWLGLRTFDLGLITVTEAGLVTYENGTQSEAGPGFVARFEKGTTWGGAAEELDAIENPEMLAGLSVLDTWLLNCDRYRPEGGRVRRNTRNVFLSEESAAKGRFRVTAMDHTHCLTCGRELTKSLARLDRIQDARLYGHFPEFKEHLSHAHVRTFTERLNTLTTGQASGFLAGVPAAWGVTADLKTTVVEFLSRRAAFVGQHIRKMLVDQGYLEPELDLEG